MSAAVGKKDGSDKLSANRGSLTRAGSSEMTERIDALLRVSYQLIGSDWMSDADTTDLIGCSILI